MLRILPDYPYLVSNLISVTLLIFLGRKLLTPRQHWLVFLSGVTNLPCFAFVVLLKDNYWAPVRLGGMALGIEDLLCTYAVAAGAWFIVSYPYRRISAGVSGFSQILKRGSTVGGGSLLFFLTMYFCKADSMFAFLLVCLVVGIVLYIRQPHLRRLGMDGLWKYPLFYLPLVKLIFLIWPDFVNQWKISTPLGRLYWGIPLGEIIWSVLFGLYWPMFMGYVYKVKIDHDKQ